MAIEVLKSNGGIEPFQGEKVTSSIHKAGGSKEVAEDVIAEIEQKAGELGKPVTTGQIYSWVKEILGQKSPGTAMRYSLRDALLQLGPTGFPFEKYIAAVLAAYGYRTQLPEMLQGACILHEVDVTMEKDNRFMMAEAKFRKNPSIFISIKDTMSTWARFLDLVDGASLDLAPHFDEAWIVTNARFSDQSLKYGHCKNMVMLGWNHPKERNLANMIDLKQLYPITILENMDKETREILFQHDITLCSQLPEALGNGDIPISKEKKQALQHDCSVLAQSD